MQPEKRKCLRSGSMETKRGSSSMSEKQRSLMLDFLADHPSMVRDRSVGGTTNKDSRDELWEELATVLNSCEQGAHKDRNGWRRSWLDLKRYESLKAKESMVRLESSREKSQEPKTIELSPLQEKISHLLNMSICDIAESLETEDCTQRSQDIMNLPSQKFSESRKEELQTENINFGSEGSEKASFNGTTKDLNIAQALHSIAHALAERNVIEEKKLKAFQSLLTMYTAKNGIDINDVANIGGGLL